MDVQDYLIYSKEIQTFLSLKLKREKEFADFLENLDFDVHRLEVEVDNFHGNNITLWTSDYSKVEEMCSTNENESFFNPYDSKDHPLVIKYTTKLNFFSKKDNNFGNLVIKIEDLEAESKKMNILCESLKGEIVFPVSSEKIVSFYEKKGLPKDVLNNLKFGINSFRKGGRFSYDFDD